jgi:uncharacterized protein YcfL
MKKYLLSFAACISLLTIGCGSSTNENSAEAVAEKQKTNALLAQSKKNAAEIEKLNEEYRDVPDCSSATRRNSAL